MSNLNLNKVILCGRLTAAPELKTTPNGVSVTSFSIAVNRDYKNADGSYTTDFINIQAWRGTAEFICRYFQKGSSICVVGAIQTRKYEDKDGNKRIAVEVVATEAKFVDSKNENGTAPTQDTVPAPSDMEFEELADDEELPF